MSSSQTINQKGDYNCKKNENLKLMSYNLNPVYGEQKNPCQMFVLGSIPSKMGSHHFSHNSIDIESKLRGIRSNNLEGSSFNPELEKKDFYTKNIFDNHLKEPIYVPRPFFHNSNLRKGFHNI